MSEMFSIRLPDGSVREVEPGTTPADIAAAIGRGLAKAAMAARVNGELRDLNRPFEADAELALVTARDEKEALELVRHDYAHVLAEAVQNLFPGTQITFGLLVPWSMTQLWNDRWNKMSFGQHEFAASANTDGLFGRWLLIYLVPVIGLFASLAVAGSMGAPGSEEELGAMFGSVAIMFVLVYIAFLLASLSYYAAFYRQVVSATSVAGIDFEFTARTKDWLKLILGNIALVLVTLGIGYVFVAYRNWSFAVRHMEASGEINLDTLFQSRTTATGDAEGLADAFDIGAI